jgi:hypothetical protein
LTVASLALDPIAGEDNADKRFDFVVKTDKCLVFAARKGPLFLGCTICTSHRNNGPSFCITAGQNS